MNNQKIVWVWVGIAVVVIAIVIAFFWKPGQEGNTNQPPSSPVPVYAPQGQLTPQFPKELILDNAAVVNDSYAISYSSSTNQETAVWTSSSSMLSLYASYKQYLPANGWTITNDITKYSTNRGLYARKDSSELVISIVTENKGSQVTIGYVTK